MPTSLSQKASARDYLSLALLFMPALLFGALLLLYRDNARLRLTPTFPYFSWQFAAIAFFGIVASAGGVLDWRFHRRVLGMSCLKKSGPLKQLRWDWVDCRCFSSCGSPCSALTHPISLFPS